MSRADIITAIAAHVLQLDKPHPLRVGIDGFPASGKTTLADEMAEALRPHGRPVIRATADGFHHPPAIRHRRGRFCPQGYYEDSFDHLAIRQNLLEPLGPEGSRKYRRAHYDYRNESDVTCPWERAAADAILLFDGLFLHRPALAPYWDFTLFVDADIQVALERAEARDYEKFGNSEAVRQAFSRRFFPGHGLYLEKVNPYQLADAVVDNTNVNKPVLCRMP